MARKKKKQDPGMLKAKEERRRKRLAKVVEPIFLMYCQKKEMICCSCLYYNNRRLKNWNFNQALKKMERKERLPKPLVECEIPIILHTERAERLRGVNVTEKVKEERILHMKDWARHCYVRYFEFYRVPNLVYFVKFFDILFLY